MHDFQKLKFSLCLHLSCDEGFLLLLKLSSQLPRLGQRLAGVHYAVWLLKRKIFLFSSWSGLFRNQPQSFLRQASPRSWPATSPTASVLLQRQPKNMAMIGGWWVARKIFDIRIFDLGGYLMLGYFVLGYLISIGWTSCNLHSTCPATLILPTASAGYKD